MRDPVCIPCRKPGTKVEDLVGLKARCRDRRQSKEDRVAAQELRTQRKCEARKRVKAKEKARKLALQDNDAAKELARRELARRSLLQYIIQVKADYLPGWVHEDVCRRLERFLADVEAGRNPRLMLFMPPRAGKSVLASQMFPAWVLGRHPEYEIIACSYSLALPLGFSRKVRALLQSPEYLAVFPQTQVDPNTLTAAGWQTTAGGGFVPAGVGGSFPGRGANILLIDDPVKDAEEADSATTREGVFEWYSSTAYTRLAPNSGVLIIQTRWNDCLVPGTMVLTPRGERPVEQVCEGDAVVSKDGITAVSAVASRPHDRDIVEAVAYGAPAPLRVTPEHRVLTSAGWKCAGDLTTQDELVVPPIDRAQPIPLWPDLPAPKAKCPSRMTGEAGRVPREDLARLLYEGKTYEQCAKHFGLAGKGSIGGYVSAYGLNRAVGNVVPGSVLLDPAFWRVVGYWLAEGSVTYGRKLASVVRFTFGAHEKADFADDIAAVMARHGVTVRFRALPSVCLASFSSQQVASYLVEHFGHGAHNKTLPEWALNLPEESLRQLIAGYFRGDGCLTAGQGFRATSTSLSLLKQFQRALARLGAPAFVRREKLAGQYRFNHGGRDYAGDTRASYSLYFHEAYAPWLDLGRGSAPRRALPKHYGARVEDGQLFLRLRRVHRTQYTGLVYDIETTMENFVAAGVVVHNCDLSGRLLSQLKEVRDEIAEARAEGDENLAQALTAAADNWEVVSYPAIATEDEHVNGRLVRRKGEALHPERFSLERLLKIKKAVIPRHWSALYQQNPIPDEGTYFTKGMIHYAPSPDWRELPIVIAGDLAIGKKQENDWTVLGAGAIDHEDRVHLLAVHRKRMGTFEIVEAILDMYERYKSTTQSVVIGIERGQLQLAIWDQLEKRMRERKLYPAFDHELKPLTDKMVRARPLQGQMEQGRVCFPPGQPWAEQVIHELLRFPGGVFDDCVDMLAWMARMRSRVFAPKPPKSRRLKSWKDKLGKHMKRDGAGGAMAA